MQVSKPHASHTWCGTFHPQPGNGNPSGPTGHGASKPGIPCYHGNKHPKHIRFAHSRRDNYDVKIGYIYIHVDLYANILQLKARVRQT